VFSGFEFSQIPAPKNVYLKKMKAATVQIEKLGHNLKDSGAGLAIVE